MINFSHSKFPGVERSLRIILLVALAMRLYGLTGFSMSNDELSALSRLDFSGFGEVVEQGVKPDFHPAGVQLFLFVWTHVFGLSEFAVRFPFAIMGVVSVLLLFHVGKSWFGESTGLLAASALAVLEFPLLYSQIARPYSPGLMFGLAAVFFWSRFLGVSGNREQSDRDKGSWRYATGFVLSVVACMYIHYFAFIFAGLVCFAGLFFLDRKTFGKYLLCGAAIAVLYLPGLDVFTHQLAKGGIGGPDGWLAPPTAGAFGAYIDYVFNNSSLLQLMFLIAFAGTFLVYRNRIPFRSRHALALFLFLTPFVIAYYYSILVNPVFQHSILLFSFPFLLLFLFSFLPGDRISFTSRFLLLILTFGGCYSTINEQHYYRTPHFTEFRAVADGVRDSKQEYGVDSVTVLANVHSPFYLNYYLGKQYSLSDSGVTRITNEGERIAFYAALATATTPFLAYAHSNIYTPSEFDLAIRQYYPDVIRLDTFLNSGFRLYARNTSEKPLQAPPDLIRIAEFNSPEFKNRLDTSNLSKPAIRFETGDEFGPAIEGSVLELGLRKGCVVYGHVALEDFNELEGVMLVFSIEQGANKLFYKANEASLFRHGLRLPMHLCMVAEMDFDIPRDAQVKLYVWNRDKKNFKIRDLNLSVYRERPNTFFPPM